MKIAHFSPLPPQRSGIASYCNQLVPYLAQYMEVDAFTSAEAGKNPNPLSFKVRPISEFWHDSRVRYQYDLCLYHMGNHPSYHHSIFATLVRYPGVTVLHDLNLHAFFLQLATRENARAAYLREMGYAYGVAGIVEAMRLYLQGSAPPQADQRPLFERVTDSSLGVVVHTEQARLRLQSASPRLAVVRIPLAAALPDPGKEPKRPAQLEPFPPDALVLASFGYVAPSKRIDVILRALSQLRPAVPPFYYLLVGQPISDYDLSPLIRELGLDDLVFRFDFVDDTAFEALLGSIDIGLNLRTGPTGGEMSATMVRLLAHGRPVLVSNVGGFAELPEDVVLKIGQDEQEITQLVTVLRHLMSDASARKIYGRSAQAYAASHLSFSVVARQYAAFVTDCLQSLLSQR